MFQDVFSELFSILFDKLEGLTMFESALRPTIRHELLSVRESPADAPPLTGRIGPIRAIKGILEIGKWDTAIDRTETMIACGRIDSA
ncbi:hypothetical protein KI688_002543 [Linnemannia hyalina]|uniref:Uncharacterized protein n=1 Tax=Linnemannia hyalina TaxID=64524 RepID=A0A9P7XPV8_9FUNG|nr:hypothetical protein KI688_002543 [Linnemannia hyalina]